MADFELARSADHGMAMRLNVPRDYGHVDSLGVNYRVPSAVGATGPVTIYKMRGMDALTAGLYDSWVATGAPDSDGSDYAGALNKPLRDIVIVDQWEQ